MKSSLLIALSLFCAAANAYPQGLLFVKDYAFYKDSEAKPIEYEAIKAFGSVTWITHNGQRQRIESQKIVNDLPYSSIKPPQNIVSASDLSLLKSNISTINDTIRKWPASQKYLNLYLQLDQNALQQFQQGYVRFQGKWIAAGEYAKGKKPLLNAPTTVPPKSESSNQPHIANIESNDIKTSGSHDEHDDDAVTNLFQCLDLMQNGKINNASIELNKIKTLSASHFDFLYAHILQNLIAICNAIRQEQVIVFNYGKIQKKLEQKLKNAIVLDHPNPLTPNDSYGGNQARYIREQVQATRNKYIHALDGSKVYLEKELGHAAEITPSLITYGAYSDAILLHDGIKSIATMANIQYQSQLTDSTIKMLVKKCAQSEKAYHQAIECMSQNEISKAEKFVGTGLQQEPANRKLKHISLRLNKIQNKVDTQLAAAIKLKKAFSYEEASIVLDGISHITIDNDSVNSLRQSVQEIIANKKTSIYKAEIDEKTGDYISALKIYTTYNMQAAQERLLPLVGKQYEKSKNYLEATIFYRKAGLLADVQRIIKLKEKQESDYNDAKILLAKDNFKDAIKLYKLYGDTPLVKEAIVQMGKNLEDRGDLDKALKLYEQAKSIPDTKKLSEFLRNKRKWIIQAQELLTARNYEKAYDLFKEANDKINANKTADLIAQNFLQMKDYANAAAYYELAGEYQKAGDIRTKYKIRTARSTIRLTAAEIFKRCSPACVTVISNKKGIVMVGSGFFFKRPGYIITNHHVVDGAESVKIVTAAGEKYDARIVFSDTTPDLAVLQAKNVPEEHPILPIGNSDRMKTGAKVFAIGTPENQAQTITNGIISNINPSLETIGKNKCFQTNTSINHGNSGGPLIDDRGEVKGINTFGSGTLAILDNGIHIGSDIQNMNFSIKINQIKEAIKSNGSVSLDVIHTP